MTNKKPEGSCDFKECRLKAGEGTIHCPRHHALVEHFGITRAYAMECGHECPRCRKTSEDHCQECETCMIVGCYECRKDGKCCDEHLEELEEKAEDAQDEAYRFRRKMSLAGKVPA